MDGRRHMWQLIMVRGGGQVVGGGRGGGLKGLKREGVRGRGEGRGKGGVQMADVNGWTPAHVAAYNGEGGGLVGGGRGRG